MITSRLQIYEAVYNKIKDLPSFKSVSQIIKMFDKLNAADTPALFMQVVSMNNDNLKGRPPIGIMGIDLIIYVRHANTQGGYVSPTHALMPLIDEVAAVFEGNEDEPTRTLDGLVSHCWVSDIVTDEGVNQNYAIGVIRLDILYT